MKAGQAGLHFSRRQWLAAAALVAAAPAIIPSTVLGRAARPAPPNRITLRVVGCGRQGGSNLSACLREIDCQVVAVCNVDRRHLAKAVERVNSRYKDQACKAYTDYREWCAGPDIDAVMIATPNHWHCLTVAEAAMRKRDIYGEKPLVRIIAEQQAIVKAVQHNLCIWQTGSWLRSRRGFHKAAEIVRNGLIGRITRAEVGASFRRARPPRLDCHPYGARNPVGRPARGNYRQPRRRQAAGPRIPQTLVSRMKSSLPLSLLLGALAWSLYTAGIAEPQRPNVLFAIADDWSFGHAGAYGCKWVETPAFDRVADQGVLFLRAYTPNAKCAPSRACILTGRNSWQLEAAANHVPHFPPKFKTFIEALDEQGWFVGYTGKGWAPGVATNGAGKPRQMTGKAFNTRTARPPAAGIAPHDYAANFTDFLDAVPSDKSWCFWYGALEPHRDYEYGSGVARAGKKPADVDRVPGYWPDNETVRNDMLDYAFEVEHFDRHLGRMLAELEKRGLLDNTLVVVTSDHGMPFPRVKGQAYESSNHVPLAMMWKHGLRQFGRKVDDFVSFIDLAPTFIELAGLRWEQTGMADATGRSLSDLLFHPRAGVANATRDRVLVGKERHDVGRPHDWGYPIRGIIQGDLVYVRNYEPTRWPAGNPETGYLNCDGGPTKTFILDAHRKNPADPHWALCFGKRPAEELYDLKRDADCVRNLAADPAFADRKRQLEQRMTGELNAQGDPRMLGRGEVFEQYPYANAGQRNFHERYLKGEKLKAGWVEESDFEKQPLD